MEKVFRDPVHNLMRFDGKRDALVLALIDTVEVQRLRQINQMGVSDLIFPGATHTRFSHALGVTYMMLRVLERIDLLRRDARHAAVARQLDGQRELLLATALLHDVGHFPFSHLMEETIGVDHEVWGIRVIQDPDSQIYRVLVAHDAAYPAQIASILRRTYQPAYAVKLISSQLDVDRLDYLLRDSIHTGVGYGKFDLDWLLHSLRIVEAGEGYEIAVDEHKGLQVAESYVLARYYMYQQVYHHRLERAAGALLLKLLQRARERLDEGGLKHTPQPVRTLLHDPETLTLQGFRQLTDALMRHAIWQWTEAKDPVMADLAQRFVARRLFKTLPMTSEQFKQLRPDLECLAREQGFDPAYYLVHDSAVVSPYREGLFGTGQGQAGQSLYLVDEQDRLTDLSQRSALINALKHTPLTLERLCLPEPLRDEAQRLALA